jgi:hypothetical protein
MMPFSQPVTSCCLFTFLVDVARSKQLFIAQENFRKLKLSKVK